MQVQHRFMLRGICIRCRWNFGFGAECREISIFSRHSVSGESNRPKFGTLSVSAWCELYFRWSPKVSQMAWDEAKHSDSLSHILELDACALLQPQRGAAADASACSCWCCLALGMPLNWARVPMSFLSTMLWVWVRSTFGFSFVFGRKCHLAFIKHSSSAKSRTPLSVLLSVSAESDNFYFRSTSTIHTSTVISYEKKFLVNWITQYLVLPSAQKAQKAKQDLQCVSKKNIPDIFSCNSRKHCRIFIMFGIHVTKKVSNQ